MAFDTTFLESLGIDSEDAQKIVDAHNQTINGNYIPKTRFDEVNKAYKQAKTDLTARDSQIESLKAFEGDNESLKAKVTELQKANEQAAAKYAHEMEALRKTTAIRGMLSDAQDATMVINLLNMDSISIDSQGHVIGAKEQLDALRESKPFLFKQATSTPTINGTLPPEGTSVRVKATSMSDYGKRLAEARNIGAKQAKTAEDYYFPKR